MAEKALRIVNARLVLLDAVLENGALAIRQGNIACIQGGASSAAAEEGGRTVDFAGDIVMPGLIDIHAHGAGGADVMDGTAQALGNISRTLLQEGTTAFLGTTLAASSAKVAAVAAEAGTFCRRGDEAEFLGLHLEGPFSNPMYKGAQPGAGIVPFDYAKEELAEWKKLLHQYSGLFHILTLAPEHPAASELTTVARALGLVVSAGHSGATYEQMQAAVDAGVRLMTHAFNGMAGIHHRQPGLLTAGLLDPRVMIELIADGVHVHPAVLELAIRLKTAKQVILVSDGTRAVGMPDGFYKLGGQPIEVQGKRAVLSDGTLAGSASSLLDGVRTVVRCAGCSLPEAARMAATNPAILLGVDNRIGSLHPGYEATFLRLDAELQLKEVWVKGERVLCNYFRR